MGMERLHSQSDTSLSQSSCSSELSILHHDSPLRKSLELPSKNAYSEYSTYVSYSPAAASLSRQNIDSPNKKKHHCQGDQSSQDISQNPNDIKQISTSSHLNYHNSVAHIRKIMTSDGKTIYV